jgi:hypothetical protein
METGVLIGVGILFLFFFALVHKNTSTNTTPNIYIVMKDSNQGISAGESGYETRGRYSRAPRPQRFWDNGPEIPVRGALDPVPTRGAPESYQQMGIVEAADGKLLPLYGRRTDPRSDRFNYYTRTDTYNPIALPIRYKNRDCQDNLGCDEMMNGDSVRLTPTGQEGKITLYGFDGPRYSPEIA